MVKLYDEVSFLSSKLVTRSYSTSFSEAVSFLTAEKLKNEHTEYGYDHVFIDVSDNTPVINTAEVVDWEKISFDQLHQQIIEQPDFYTCWFKEIYQQVNAHIVNGKNKEKG
jgi:isopentenyl-diphosphate Delta-isomerase